jgi:hypothetical protein
MSATRTFEFGDYRLQPATHKDLWLAELWTQLDTHHAGSVAPEFWLEQTPAVDSYLLFDGEGPLFFFRVQAATREAAELHLQFMPSEQPRHVLRIGKGMIVGLSWLEMMLEKAGIEQIYFDSGSDPLIQFSIKHLEFELDRRNAGSDARLRKRLKSG